MATKARETGETVITSEHQDRVNDVVRMAGGELANYRKNPVVMVQHGKIAAFPVVGGNAEIQPTTLEDRIKALVATAWEWDDDELSKSIARKWDKGILRAVSIGFLVRELRGLGPDGKPVDSLEDAVGLEFLRWELLEFSIVSVPMNPAALRRMVSRGLVDDAVARRFDPRRPTVGGVPISVIAALEPRRMRGEDFEQRLATAQEGRVVRKGYLPRGYDPTAGEFAPAPATLAIVPMELPCHEPDAVAFVRSLDPATEPLEPLNVVTDWAARYLDVPVAGLCEMQEEVPPPRIGSFLYSLEEVLAERGLELEAARRVVYGQEAPPVSRQVQLTSSRSQRFLVDATRFLRLRNDPGAAGRAASASASIKQLVVSVETMWWGALQVTVIAAERDSGAAAEILLETMARVRGKNNFLRGEAFSLTGGFIPRSSASWDGLFLTEANQRPLRRAVDRINRDGAATPNRGILLSGPPGTGKTLAGRVMRNEAQATFIWIASRDFWRVGSGHSGIVRALDMARELAPAIVFFEDVDNWIDSVAVDTLKSELDGIRQHAGVITILTTNYPERLPAALLDRPGRFHDVLRFDLPDQALRLVMLTAWVSGATAEELAATAEATDGFSGAHLRELASYAGDLAEDEGIAIGPALEMALRKVAEQRELIQGRSLAGSRYKPSARERALAPARVVASGTGFAPPVALVVGEKADDPPADEPVSCSGVHCDGCGDGAETAAHCAGCMGDEQRSAVEVTIGPRGAMVTGPAPDPLADPSLVARALKETSLERCPDCSGVAPVFRPSGRVLGHRVAATGDMCGARSLAVAPTGPRVRDVVNAVRIASDAAESARQMTAEDVARALPGADDSVLALRANARAILERVLESVTKEGRVLSAANQRLIEEALGAMANAGRALQNVLDAAKREEPQGSSVDQTDQQAASDAGPKPVEDAQAEIALAGLLADPTLARVLAHRVTRRR